MLESTYGLLPVILFEDGQCQGERYVYRNRNRFSGHFVNLLFPLKVRAMSPPIDRPVDVQTRVWMIVGAVALFFAMLAAFHHVVRDAVQQAELRHQANALVVEAIWRCNAAPPTAPSSCTPTAKAGSGSVSDAGRVSVAHQIGIEN